MRLFVSEFICGGGCSNSSRDSSLVREGLSMLRAILADCRRIPDVEVLTTWDVRLGDAAFEKVTVHPVTDPDEEAVRFRELAATCDATWLIAPEFDGILEARARIVESVGGRLVGPNSDAISLCADKLRLTLVLDAGGVATIPTEPCNLEANSGESLPFPVVIKPRDGAGSQETYLIQNRTEWTRRRTELRRGRLLRQAICQPYFRGRPVSVGLILNPHNRQTTVFPPCDQSLSADGRFLYQGGRVPARLTLPEAVQRAAEGACGLVPGLKGYVGVDLIVPDVTPDCPLVVEINPRLTTSYLGYAALAMDNLASRILFPDIMRSPLEWKKQSVTFEPDGIAATPQ